jgi:hypothetical protein
VVGVASERRGEAERAPSERESEIASKRIRAGTWHPTSPLARVTRTSTASLSRLLFGLWRALAARLITPPLGSSHPGFVRIWLACLADTRCGPRVDVWGVAVAGLLLVHAAFGVSAAVARLRSAVVLGISHRRATRNTTGDEAKPDERRRTNAHAVKRKQTDEQRRTNETGRRPNKNTKRLHYCIGSGCNRLAIKLWLHSQNAKMFFQRGIRSPGCSIEPLYLKFHYISPLCGYSSDDLLEISFRCVFAARSACVWRQERSGEFCRLRYLLLTLTLTGGRRESQLGLLPPVCSSPSMPPRRASGRQSTPAASSRSPEVPAAAAAATSSSSPVEVPPTPKPASRGEDVERKENSSDDVVVDEHPTAATPTPNDAAASSAAAAGASSSAVDADAMVEADGVNGSESKYDRLHHLLDQTSLFSKFLSERMPARYTAINAAASAASTSTGTKQHLADRAASLKELIPKGQGLELRDFQVAGIDWLISLYENGLNGILAGTLVC